MPELLSLALDGGLCLANILNTFEHPILFKRVNSTTA